MFSKPVMMECSLISHYTSFDLKTVIGDTEPRVRACGEESSLSTENYQTYFSSYCHR